METLELLKMMQVYANEFKVPIIEQESVQWLETFLCDKNINNILEIGGAISYSTIYFQQCTQAKVLSVEKDEIRFQKAQEFLLQYKNQQQIMFVNDDAKSDAFFKLVQDNAPYDLIFIDATKRNNQVFFEKFSPYLKTGGYIVTDNIAFHGLADESEVEIQKLHRRIRPMVRAIIAYRKWLTELEGFKTEFIDIGDVLAITQKL